MFYIEVYKVKLNVLCKCLPDNQWFILQVKVSGLTGDLLLQHGRRLLFNLDIVQLMKEGLEKVGTLFVSVTLVSDGMQGLLN